MFCGRPPGTAFVLFWYGEKTGGRVGVRPVFSFVVWEGGYFMEKGLGRPAAGGAAWGEGGVCI